jgi:hypothetical protein
MRDFDLKLLNQKGMYAALRDARDCGKRSVSQPISSQTFIICLIFVVSAMALWDSLELFSGAQAASRRFDELK